MGEDNATLSNVYVKRLIYINKHGFITTFNYQRENIHPILFQTHILNLPKLNAH